MSSQQMVQGTRPATTAGLRHVALFVKDISAAQHFYITLLGMRVEWQPDSDNVYLTSGTDNLALHRMSDCDFSADTQRLDHIGFILDYIDDVDHWFDFLRKNNVVIKSEPRTHRDGARSFYCLDPDGTVVQMIYHPSISVGC